MYSFGKIFWQNKSGRDLNFRMSLNSEEIGTGRVWAPLQ